MNSREALRKKLRIQRASLTPNDQVTASQSITARFIANALFQESHNIAVYVSTYGEINPDAIVKTAWADHKRCYLPILQKNELFFGVYEKNTPLKNNRLHIPEPCSSMASIIDPGDLDVVLVPLLGFTRQGERLGMGGGFYDRSFNFLLKNPRPLKPFLIGLAYEWQKLETLKTNNWDVPLNAVFTEKETYTYIKTGVIH